MVSWRVHGWGLLLLGAAACAWAALAGAVACHLSPVRLGAVLPLTGALAPYGKSLERGARLGAEQVNASGGIEGRRLELLVVDSASSPTAAAKLFQQLVVEERVPAVVGGASTPECLAMAPVAERYRRVVLSPSASGPQISAAGDFVFRNWPSDEIEGRTLADFAAYTLHASRVLVVSERNPYAEGFASVFTRRFCAQGRTCASLALDTGRPPEALAADLAGSLRRCEVLVLAGYAGDLLPLLKFLKSLPDLPPILSVSALGEGRLLEEPAMDGVLFARPAYDPEGDPVAAEFASLYAAKFGQEPDIYAAHAYDAVRLLAEVMVKAGLGAAGLQRGLLSVRNYPGAAGSTSFDSNGDVIQPYQICAVAGGRAVPLKSVVESVLPPLQQRVQSRRFGK